MPLVFSDDVQADWVVNVWDPSVAENAAGAIMAGEQDLDPKCLLRKLLIWQQLLVLRFAESVNAYSNNPRSLAQIIPRTKRQGLANTRSGRKGPTHKIKRSEESGSEKKSNVWFVRAGFVRKLHLLRNALSAKMSEFLITAAPQRARRQDSELFRRWV